VETLRLRGKGGQFEALTSSQLRRRQASYSPVPFRKMVALDHIHVLSPCDSHPQGQKMKKAETQRFWSANPIRAAFCREGYGVTILLIVCTNHWAAVEFGLAIGIAVKSTWEQRSQLKGLSDWSYKLVMRIFHHWAHYIRNHNLIWGHCFLENAFANHLDRWHHLTSPNYTRQVFLFEKIKTTRCISSCHWHKIQRQKRISKNNLFESSNSDVEDPGSSTFQHWIQPKNGSPQWWQKSVYTCVPSRLTVGTRHTCGCFLHKGNLRSSVHIHLSHLHSCLQFHTGKLLNVGSIAWDKHPSMQYCGGNSTLLAPEAS